MILIRIMIPSRTLMLLQLLYVQPSRIAVLVQLRSLHGSRRPLGSNGETSCYLSNVLTEHNDPRNHTNYHETLSPKLGLVSFRVGSRIVRFGCGSAALYLSIVRPKTKPQRRRAHRDPQRLETEPLPESKLSIHSFDS